MLEGSVLSLRVATDEKKMCSKNEKQSHVTPYIGGKIRLN